jgi:hypothetical protein
MIRRLFKVLEWLALPLPIIGFLAYYFDVPPDYRWTFVHLGVTGLFAIPFIILMLIKFVIYGSIFTQTKDNK